MPAHPALDDEELALVVLYERVQFGGLEEDSEEYELLLAIAEGRDHLRRGGPGRHLRRRRGPRGGPRRRLSPRLPVGRPDRQTDTRDRRRTATTSSSSAAGPPGRPPGTGSGGPGATW